MTTILQQPPEGLLSTTKPKQLAKGLLSQCSKDYSRRRTSMGETLTGDYADARTSLSSGGATETQCEVETTGDKGVTSGRVCGPPNATSLRDANG